MGLNKKDLINFLSTSVQDLQQGINAHCCLVSSILEEEVDERNLQAMLDRCPKGSREIELEKAIREAIDVIEESRKSFKSKRLETLRKKLTAVLMNTE